MTQMTQMTQITQISQMKTLGWRSDLSSVILSEARDLTGVQPCLSLPAGGHRRSEGSIVSAEEPDRAQRARDSK
jgi:hypothetical protein